MLVRTFEIDPARLRRAVEATFARRGTPLPAALPEGLTDAFAQDDAKQRQWTAFVRNLSSSSSAPTLRDIVTELRAVVMELLKLPS